MASTAMDQDSPKDRLGQDELLGEVQASASDRLCTASKELSSSSTKDTSSSLSDNKPARAIPTRPTFTNEQLEESTESLASSSSFVAIDPPSPNLQDSLTANNGNGPDNQQVTTNPHIDTLGTPVVTLLDTVQEPGAVDPYSRSYTEIPSDDHPTFHSGRSSSPPLTTSDITSNTLIDIDDTNSDTTEKPSPSKEPEASAASDSVSSVENEQEPPARLPSLPEPAMAENFDGQLLDGQHVSFQEQDSRQLPVRPHLNQRQSSNHDGLSLLPPLPNPEDMSIVGDSRLINDTMNEDVVRAHLQDVESSFVPEMSPIPVQQPKSANETFNYVEPPSPTPQQQPMEPRSAPGSTPNESTATAIRDGNAAMQSQAGAGRFIPASTTPRQSQQQAPPNSLIFSSHNNQANQNQEDHDMSLNSLLNAPSGENTQQQNHKDLSYIAMNTNPHGLSTTSTIPSTLNAAQSQETTTSANLSNVATATANQSNNENENFEDSQIFSDEGDTSFYQDDSMIINQDQPSKYLPRVSKRSKYLRSRHGAGFCVPTSSRSSMSTRPTTPRGPRPKDNDGSSDKNDDDGASDITVEAASKSAALVAAATVAANSNDPSRTIRQTSMFMQRSISMGSMGSAVDDTQRIDQQMGRLGDDGLPMSRNMEPKTPKPKTVILNPPTDTVIARHVRTVQVPDNMVEEYKFKGDLITPRKISESLNAGIGRSATGKNMTLREQSSTIEKLSKENFDLKLKVMFLKDRLDRLSEEGIKQMVSENVDLKTTLAITQRDCKALRKRVKQLEKQLKEEEQQKPKGDNGDDDEEDEEAAERNEEILYLRERVEEYVVEIEKLKLEVLNKDNEKRRMSEMVRTLSERAPGENLDRQEETDVWKDLLEQETSRREQADEDNRRLRDELFRLKQEMTTGIGSAKKSVNLQTQSPQPMSGLSSEFDNTNISGSITLVDELRRESEQLRHENAELRREVGAQTSMLTSRNREKERLYQEIEDLKMAQRRGNPAPSTVDSLLDRSASRAGVRERSHSRASGTRITAVEEDPDREELENTIADLRDKLNAMKLQNTELTSELEKCMDDFEAAINARKESEEHAMNLQEDMDIAMNDLVELQAERDEALRDQAELEGEFGALRKEAQEEIDALEAEADERTAEIERLTTELNERTENFKALQGEMRQMSEAVIRLEDDAEEKMRRIREMEGELESANKELEELEHKLLEANEKVNRIGVQQESSAGEIAFLREEQETDKIRIGDLEAALANCQQSLRDEKERVKELDQRLATERQQREIMASKEKEEVQQFVNELNREATSAQDESRRLRKMLTSREVEATEWKERLMELENNLRVALGDLNGTRSSLLKSIANLQRQNEDTVRELDSSKAVLLEKDRIIKHRDSILESQALESRKLADLLEKERQAHRNTKNTYETFQNMHHHVTRTASTLESRLQELESSRLADKKKIHTLETNFKEQMTERNNLLLFMWTRLSGLCGTDWAMNNSLINGRALPSLESVSTMLSGFSKNLLAAVKHIELMMNNFSTRIKSVERDLWREYQALESNLESRIKKLDRLEMLVRNGIANNSIPASLASMGAVEMQARYQRLEEAYRQLKVENTTLRTATDVRNRAAFSGSAETAVQVAEIIGGSPSPGVPMGPRDKERGRSSRKNSGLVRPGTSSRGSNSSHGHSMSMSYGGSGIPVPSTSHGGGKSGLIGLGVNMGMDMVTRPDTAIGTGEGEGTTGSSSERGLVLRLKEMEKKLIKEREGRYQDRHAAKQRLAGLDMENKELRAKQKRAEM